MRTGPLGRKRLFLLAATCLACAAARAQEIDYSLGASSALLVRGVALGGGRPALQASIGVAGAGGWLGALGIAGIRPGDGEGWNTQLHARLGYGVRLDDEWSAQVAAARYAYPFDSALRAFDRNELGASLSWRDQLHASVTALRQHQAEPYGPRNGTAWDLVARQPLRRGESWSLAANAGVGWQERGGWHYRYGHLGLGGRLGELQWDVARVATDREARERLGSAAEPRWVLSVAWVP